jgi:hypothetical protein
MVRLRIGIVKVENLQKNPPVEYAALGSNDEIESYCIKPI